MLGGRQSRFFTLSDVTGVVEGRSGGARSSYNKIFWSELDIHLHRTALAILGALGWLASAANAGEADQAEAEPRRGRRSASCRLRRR